MTFGQSWSAVSLKFQPDSKRWTNPRLENDQNDHEHGDYLYGMENDYDEYSDGDDSTSLRLARICANGVTI